MSFSSALRAELFELLLRRDEEDAAQQERLQFILRTDVDARRYYIRQTRLMAQLCWMTRPMKESSFENAAATTSDELIPASQTVVLANLASAKATRVNVSRLFAFGISALLLIYFAVLMSSVMWDRAGTFKRGGATTPASEKEFAKISHSENCTWAENGGPRTKDAIAGEILELRQGSVQIEFAKGAKITLIAPVQFVASSANGGYLKFGKVFASVPKQAIGFMVETPTAKIIDLGTEFSVESRNGVTDLHVFKGAVVAQVADLPGRSKRVVQQQALRIERVDGQSLPTFSALEFKNDSSATFRNSQDPARSTRDDRHLLLEYLFNDTGSTSSSTGRLNAPVELRDAANQLADLHSKPGLGVAGDLVGHPLFGIDRAFDNTASTGMGYPNQRGGIARHAINYQDIDELLSWTASGWFKTAGTTPIKNGARLFNNALIPNAGFYVYGDFDDALNTQLFNDNDKPAPGGAGRDGTGDLRVLVNTDESHISSYPSQGYKDTQKWVFFAVTYDGTQTVDNLHFYKGYRNAEEAKGFPNLVLVATRTLNEGRVKADQSVLGIGNWGQLDRPFQGYLDNMRIDGSHEDSSGALTLEALEARRSEDVTVEEASPK